MYVQNKSYLMDVQNKGGVEGTFGQCPKGRCFFSDGLPQDGDYDVATCL